MNDKAMTVRGGSSSSDGPIEAHLWVCSGKNVGRRYRVDETPRVLGRALDSDIVVEDERASQSHARLFVQGGDHIIEDQGSTNGTFVNNQRIQRVPLRDGDLLQIGETVYEYLSHEERTLSTTSRGTQPESDAVPDNLRSGAQQMLRRVRRDQVESVPTAEPPRGAPPAPHPPAPVALQGPNPPPPGMPQHPVPYGGGYPPYPPTQPYGGHYAGYYDDDNDDDDDEPEAKKSNFDLMATLVRIKSFAALYVSYWPMAVAFAFVGVMLGALHFKMKPPGKTAEFQIVLRTAGTSANVVGGAGFDGNDRLQFFGDQVAERFLSPPVIEAAFERVNGKSATAEDVSDMKEELDFFKIGLTISNQYGGTMKAAKGDVAIRYLNTHLDIWLEREIELGLGQVKADVRFFQAEVKNASRRLDEAENALSEYKAANPDALPDQAKSNYNLLFGLQQKQSNLQSNTAALQATLRENRRALARTQRLHTTAITTTNPYLTQIATVNSNIAAARASGKGDDHPDIKRMRAQLAELEQLARDKERNAPQRQVALNSSYQMLEQRVQQETAQLRALQEEMKKVAVDLEQQRNKIKALPKAEAEFQELARTYESAQQEYATLLKKLKNAELQLDRERARADAQYAIVVPPYVKHVDEGKIRKVRLAVGGVGGLALSFLFATALLFRNGKLSLSLLLGREIDLSPLLGGAPPLGGPPAGPALAAGGGAPGGALPAERAPTAALPPKTRGGDSTEVLDRRK